jgi:PBSX family phage portal protein
VDLRDEVGGTERRRRQQVRALVFGEGGRLHKAGDGAAPPEASKSLSEPDLWGSGIADQIVDPPLDPLGLASLVEQSAALGPLVEAMEANIEGFGWRLVPLLGYDATPARKEEAAAERRRLDNFFRYATTEESFTSLRRRTRRDLEVTGNAYWEVVRSLRGEIVGLKLLPSYQVRLCYEDRDYTAAEAPVLEVQPDGTYILEKRRVYRRFRRFVQGALVAMGQRATAQYRYFKSFRDPRVVDNQTGEVVPAERVERWDREGGSMPEARRANEVIHWRIGSPRTPYGLPRWLGNLLGALGARSAEEINYGTFRNQCVPSMLLLVSNGQLTEATIKRIETFVESHLKGGDNYSRFLLLEGEGAYEGEDSGHVKIDAKPLTQAQHTDALFTNYIGMCHGNLRQAFRLPGLFVGKDDGYNRATAEVARRLADEQVFAPERAEVDWAINALVLADLGARYYRFETRTPNVTDNAELVSMLTAAERTGAITPRLARAIVEDVFPGASEAPPLDPRVNPDLPFSLTMAEAVKNQAQTTEVNQQVAPVQASGVVKAIRDDLIADLLATGDRAATELRRLLRRDE